jgi:hypothetical protein
MAFLGILPEQPSLAQKLGRGLGVGLTAGIGQATELGGKLFLENAKKARRNALIEQIEGNSNGQGSDVQQLMGQSSTDSTNAAQQLQGRNQSQADPFAKAKMYAAAGEDQLARLETERAKSTIKERIAEREFQSKRSEKYLEDIDTRRETLRAKENAIVSLSDAIENMPGGFSTDYLAEVTGYEPFRTAKGAQFKTATKEFLLGNLNRAGARPNMWIEQQIDTMAAKIGRSKEANETFVAATKADLNVERKKIEIASDLEEKYQKELGYVPKNIARQVEDQLKPYAEYEQAKLAYKLRQIHEKEIGKDLQKLSRVPKGTPLTLEKAKVIYQKSPGKSEAQKEANAEKIALSLGYTIPPKEIYMSNE